jgi:outer membrane protein TolC
MEFGGFMIKFIKVFVFIFAGNLLAIGESEFVYLLQKHHPFFNEKTTNLQNLDLAKKVANPYQDWNFTSTINHTGSKNSLVNKLEKTRISGDTITIENGIVDNYESQTSPYSSDLSISYKIPLLENKDGINNKLNLNLAEFDEEIGKLQTKIDKQSFINSNVKDFYKMKFLEEKLIIVKEQLNIEQEQLKILKDKFKSNLVDKADVLLQTNNAQNAQITIEDTKYELGSLIGGLKNIIGDRDINNDFDLYKLRKNNNKFNLKTLTNLTIFDLKNSRYQREVKSLKNKQKSQVDLSFGISQNNVGNSIFGDEISGDNSINVGLVVALPLGGTLNKDLITQKNNQIDILKSQKQQKIIELKSQNNTILLKLNNLKKVIKINQEQVKISKQKVAEFEKMYKNNNTEFSFVISARSSQKKFELSYISNLLSYHNLQLDYKLLTL